MSKTIAGRLLEPATVARRCWPVTPGCPFARGELEDALGADAAAEQQQEFVEP